MSIAHPPSVFVSSTCYDLAQVRNDLRLFFESLGMVPVLSEFSSFPVDPNLNAIDNCRAGVREKADIFVLVVGGRYGSETESGRSVTNLEYLEAKIKGIPRYVFVQSTILTALSIWKKNRSGDFSGIVDSPKLFEFVESLYDSKENWVFPFGYAQDIMGILRTQLAYLFMDSLTIRSKVLCAGLPESLKDLSGPALLFAVQKPFEWEYRLFSQVLCDEIYRASSIKKDLNYGIALGKSTKLSELSKIVEWLQSKLGEMRLLSQSAERLVNAALPKAVDGPGDVEEIVYVGKRLAEVYRRILEWSVEFRHIQVDEEFQNLMGIVSQMSSNSIVEIETFAADLYQRLNSDERMYEMSKQPQSFKITLKLTCHDMTELDVEVRRISERLGLVP